MRPGTGSFHRGRIACLLAAAAVVAGGDVLAQESGTRPQRPNRAIFGGGRGDATQSLIFSAGLGLGRDYLRASAPIDSAPLPDRVTDFANGSAGLAYSLAVTKVSFGASVSSSARYMPDLDNGVISSHGAAVNGSVQVSQRTTVSGDYALNFQPLSASSLFPGLFQADGAPPLPTDYDLGASAENYLSDSGSAQVSHSLTKRTGLSFGYTYSHSKATGQLYSQRSAGVSGGVSHALGKGLGLRLGYGRRIGQYGNAAPGAAGTVRQHTIDAGVNFSRALSFSRQTVLSFSTGSGVFSDGVGQRYDLTGGATLSHQWGRSWSTGVAYARQMGFIDALIQPTFADSLSASLTGLLSRRFSLDAGGGVSDGTIGLTGNTNGYRAYRGTVGLTTGITSAVGVRVDYVYYTYRFDTTQFLPTALGRNIRRQSVQVSLDFSAPLIYRGRSANAAR